MNLVFHVGICWLAVRPQIGHDYDFSGTVMSASSEI